jgi:cytochrome c oxidase subunit IV
LVDYFNVQGGMRWTLVIVFMLLKAGFIVAVFMHVMWERLALIVTLLGPPVVLLLLIGFMTVEGKYTFGNRVDYRGDDANAMPLSPSDIHGEEEH